MMKALSLLLLFPLVSSFGNQAKTAEKRAVDVAIGNTFQRIPSVLARQARTGQKKIFKYTFYAQQLTGEPNAIKSVEFFPDVKDWTYLPVSYVKSPKNDPKTNRKVFETSHDCWGTSPVRIKITFKDGTVKSVEKRIRFKAENEAKFRFRYQDKEPPPAARAFGVELEFVAEGSLKPGKIRDAINSLEDEACLVTGWNSNTMKAWKIETDNTINTRKKKQHGIELVSPILRGEKGYQRLQSVVAVVCSTDQVLTNDSCGYHVHFDLANVKFHGLKRICQNWIKYEDAIDLFLSQGRRDSQNEHCLNVCDSSELSGKTNKEANLILKRKATLKGLCNAMNGHPAGRNRYYKLNLQNLRKTPNPRNTIEFRGQGGTLDQLEIENWIRFLNAFIDASIKGDGPVKPFADSMNPYEKFGRLFENFICDAGLYKFYTAELLYRELEDNVNSYASMEGKGMNYFVGQGPKSIRHELRESDFNFRDDMKYFYSEQKINLAGEDHRFVNKMVRVAMNSVGYY